MPKTYKLRVYWEMSANMEIQADSLDEAISIAEGPDTPLPDNGEYVDGSFEVDTEYAYIFGEDE